MPPIEVYFNVLDKFLQKRHLAIIFCQVKYQNGGG